MILKEDFAVKVSRAARENLQRDGLLIPALFMEMPTGTVLMTLLESPEGERWENRDLVKALGRSMKAIGITPVELLLVAESWYVTREENYMGGPVHEEEDRMSAISVMGRSNDGKRVTMVLYPLGTNEDGEPVIFAPLFERYDVERDERDSTDLLDAFYEGGDDD